MNLKKIVDLSLVLLVYSSFAFIMWPFKQALIFAILFSFALVPTLNKFSHFKKVKLTEIQSISILVFSLLIVLVLPLVLILTKAGKTLSQIGNENILQLPLFQKLQSVANLVTDKIAYFSDQFGFDIASQIDLKSLAGTTGQFIISNVTGLLANIPSALFQTLIFILMLYYFLLNRNKIKLTLIDSAILAENQIDRLAELFKNVSSLVLVSTILIALAQSLVVSLASLIVGFDDVFIIFLIAFFMSFIPVIGSAPLTISLVVYSLSSGHYGDAVMMAIAAGFASLIDNIIKTYLFSSKKDSVSPLLILLGIIGALNVFGIIGLFLGPIIVELTFKIGLIIFEEKKSFF